MQIILSAVETDLANAWDKHCGDLDNVTIHQGSILDLKVDAIVSPANSFGFMDGGIDMFYSQHFGWHLQDRLQDVIKTVHHGELLVGAAEVIETDSVRTPFMFAAPTMRVPMVLANTVHPYLAARAVLLLWKEGRFQRGALAGERISDAVQTVAFPGLGTGVGRVPVDVCAQQMRAAMDEIMIGKWTFPTSWSEAQIRHQKLYTDQIRDLQR